MARKIERIFVHCTAGWPAQTIGQLRAEFKAKGWKNPGYHYVVCRDGNVEAMQPEGKSSNGVAGYNATALNVAYIGGITRDAEGRVVGTDNRTDAQKGALRALLVELRGRYPDARIMGHRSIWGEGTPWKWKKECPCFNAVEEYKDI